MNKHRVLVVDDDPIFAELAATSLLAAGYEVATAADGVEALETLDRESFQAAIVDLSMPRIDGFRLIGLVRGAQRFRSLAIIVVTVHEDKEAVAEALSLGANDYMSKPIDWRSFPARVERVLSAA
jgi:DNA-binding response OmpR family regulator